MSVAGHATLSERRVPDAAFIQQFTRTRFGWRVTTERVGEGMATGPGVFAFTLDGAKAKGERIVVAMVKDRDTRLTVEYTRGGCRIPPPPPPPPRKSDGELRGIGKPERAWL